MSRNALGIVNNLYPNVTKVVDSKKDVIVIVEEGDNMKGKRKAPSQCAMANAAQRDYDGAIISLSTSYLIKGNVATRFFTGPSVAREIVSFDRSGYFAPGTYKLKRPGTGRTLGTRYDRGGHTKKNSPSVKLGKQYRHLTQGVRSL